MPSTIPRVTASSISCSSAITIKRQPPNPSRPNLTRLVACVSSKEEKEVAHCVVWKKKKKKKKTTNYEALFVSSLVVDEKYRRQGIASKLLEEVELLARESEVDNVELTVNNWNANALSLYEKRGFRMLKEEGEDFKEKIMQFAEDPLRMVQKRMVMVVKWLNKPIVCDWCIMYRCIFSCRSECICVGLRVELSPLQEYGEKFSLLWRRGV